LANKKGDRYKCDECGLVIFVEEPCGCETTEITCCGEPIKSLAAQKEKPKASSKANPKPSSKTSK
jgi:hypothetical protein